MPAFPKPSATETDPVASPLVEAEAEDRAAADSAHAALTTSAHGGIVASAEKGAANGVATLDGSGRLPASQQTIGVFEYQGTWNASTNSPTLADGTGTKGFLYRVATGGSRNLGSGSITFDVGDYVIHNGTAWEKADTTDAVSSVNGRTGAVTGLAEQTAVTAVEGLVASNTEAIGAEVTRATTAEGTKLPSNAVDTDSTMAADSDARVPSQKAVKAALAPKAALASPALTGNPTAPTQTAGNNSTRLATTAYADAAVTVESGRATTAEALLAPKASPTFTGTVTVPDQAAADNSTKAANTKYVDTASGLLVPKSLVDAKGDLLVGTADNTVTRKAVGTDGQVLTADASTADGTKWVSPDNWTTGYPRVPAPTLTTPGQTLQTQSVVAGRLYVQRFRPDRNMAATVISFEVVTADTANNPVHVGLVDAAGLLLGTSGAVTGKLNAGARVSVVPFGSTVNLAYGRIYGACLLVPTITTSLQIRGANLGGSGNFVGLLTAADGAGPGVFPSGCPWSFWAGQTVIGNLTLGSLSANQGGPVVGVGES